MASVRETIMNELGVTSDDAKALINGYGRNHNGKIRVSEIISNVKNTADRILAGLPKYSEYDDFYHEVMECGKDRQYEAIQEICGEADTLAMSCLPSDYANDIDAWAKAVYHATQHEFECLALSNGIEGYRDYVSTLPYGGHSISRMADALNAEPETTEFLAKNGTEKDFQNYMIDISHNQKNQLVQHGCPMSVSNLIFESVKENISKGEFYTFNRKQIMKDLSRINKSNFVDSDEKQYAEKLYVQEFEKNGYRNSSYMDSKRILIISTSDIDNKRKVLDAYEKSDSVSYRRYLTKICASKNSDKNNIMTDFMSNVPENSSSETCTDYLTTRLDTDNVITQNKQRYTSMMNNLSLAKQNDRLNIDTLIQIVHDAGLYFENDYDFNKSDNTYYAKYPYISYDFANNVIVTDKTKSDIMDNNHFAFNTQSSDFMNYISNANKKETEKAKTALNRFFNGQSTDIVSFLEGVNNWKNKNYACVHENDNTYIIDMRTAEPEERYFLSSLEEVPFGPRTYLQISCNSLDDHGCVHNEFLSPIVIPKNKAMDVLEKYASQAKTNGAYHSVEKSLFHCDPDYPYYVWANEVFKIDDKYVAPEQLDLSSNYFDINEQIFDIQEHEQAFIDFVLAHNNGINKMLQNIDEPFEAFEDFAKYVEKFESAKSDNQENDEEEYAQYSREPMENADQTEKSQRSVPSNFETITEQAEKEQEKKDKTKEESPAD